MGSLEINGKDFETGRFVQGNQVARGRGQNVQTVRVAELKKQFIQCMGPEDLETVYAKLYELVREGNLKAIGMWLEHIIGRPIQSVHVTGADGESLGVTIDQLIQTIVVRLDKYPEARLELSAAIGEIIKSVAPGTPASGG